jgi:tetratricopeptide (TPR) repeat protein
VTSRGRALALFCAILAARASAAEEGASLSGQMQAVAAAYRAGHYFDALWAATDILDHEPDNTVAKNYVWTITRKIQKDRDVKPLSHAELDRALFVAGRALESRRQRTAEILSILRETDQRTRSSRSPQDLLSGMAGLDAVFDKNLSSEMADEQARAYKRTILENLKASLDRGVFVSEKDHLRAEGYLAYFKEDWNAALSSWRRAAALDPADARLQKDVDSLQSVLARRERDEKLMDLTREARIHFQVGDNAQASETWKEVLALDPQNAEAKSGLAAARVALEKTRRRARLKTQTEEGLKLYRAGDAFSAAEIWLEVLQEDPTFEEARRWLQYAGRKIGAAGAARREAPRAKTEEAPAPQPSKAMDLYKEGVIQYAQDNVARAIELWRQALSLDPQLTRAQEALRQAQAELSLQ